MIHGSVHLTPSDAAKVISAAGASFPGECCGLLEGAVDPEGWRVLAVHETRNIAEQPEHHFLMDPQQQFELLHRLRGTGRELIGCFHSHPGGRPEPSSTDLASAADEDFLWLIAGGTPGNFTLKCYDFIRGAFEPLELIQSEGTQGTVSWPW